MKKFNLPKIHAKRFQQGFIRLTKKFLMMMLTFLVVISGSGLYFLFQTPKVAEAAWYDESWAYREAIPLTTHTASETNVYDTFQLDTATLITNGKLQSSCQDIRVTDQYGQLLSYHVGRTNACNTSTTTIDYLIPTMPSGAQTYYVYYGNPAAPSKDAGAFSQSLCGNSCTTNPTLGTEAKGPGPVVLWHLNEGYGTTTSDSSTNSNTGTLSGTTKPTWRTEDLCISGKCLYFDGASSYVAGGAGTSVKITGALTLSAWVRLNTVNVVHDIISKNGDSSHLSYRLYTDASGNLNMTVSGSGSNTFTATGNITALTLTANQWYFVTGVYNPSTSVTVYVNGIQVGQNTTSIPASIFDSTTNQVNLGAENAGASNFLKGFIDEAKIYNYVRTAAQILTDYQARGNPVSSGTNLGLNQYNNPAALSNGLIGYWNMNESSGNPADSSGNGVTLTNNNSTPFNAGKFGNAPTFNGSNRYFSTATTISGVQTIAFWAYSASTTDNYINLVSGNYINSSSGTIAATGFTSPTYFVNGVQTASPTISANTWTHIVVTTNSSISASAFEVGRANGSYGANNSQLDEIRVYNRAFSSQDVANLYTFAPGPVGSWNFEEGSGTTAYDISTNANNGTLTNNSGSGTPTYTPGKIGKALSFTAANNQFVDLGNTNIPDTTEAFTLSAWINPTSVSTSQGIYAQYSGTAFAFIFVNPGELEFCQSACSNIATSTTNVISANTWQYVTVTDDGSGNVKFYVNGVNVTNAGTADTGSTNGKLIAIGRHTSQYFDGKIDQVIVYSYMRTQQQIVEDMNAGHPTGGSPVQTQVGYWKFNEGYGTTAYDSSINKNNLTMNNFSSPATSTSGWTNSGKFGKALIYNGTTNNAIIGGGTDPAALKITGALSLSAWINLTDTSSQHDIVCKWTGTASSSSYCMFIDTSGKLNFEYSSGGTPSNTTVTGNKALSTATWYHVVAIFNPSDNVYFYINGIQDKKSSTSATSLTNSTTSLCVGAENCNAITAKFFTGTIDEVKVYAGALTPAQVLIDFNRSSSEVLGALSDNSSYQNQAANQEYCVPGDSTSCSAPVGEWRLAENTGTAANDTSGNGNTGTITGTTWVPAKFGSALKFNNTNNDHVDMGNVLNGSLVGSSATFETWGYLTGTTGNGQIAINKQSAYRLQLTTASATTPTFNGPSGCAVTANTALSLNTWYHVTAAFASGSSSKIYINGSLDSSVSCSGTIVSNTNILEFGRSSAFGGISNLLGYLAKIQIYAYVRSPAQIAWDYNRGNPVAWYKFDDCQGTTINDSSGNGYSGTQSGTTAGTCTTASTFWGGASGNSTTNSGKVNYAGTFNGSSDNIQTAAISPLAVTANTTTNASWGGWFNPASSTATKTLIEKSKEFQLTTDSSGDPICGIYYSGAFHNSAAPSTSLTLSSWNHVLCTYDGTNITTYLNGIQIKQSAETNNITTDGTTKLYLGQTSGGANFYQGRMDEVRIYNYPLTSAQVKILYNYGTVTYGPSSGTP